MKPNKKNASAKKAVKPSAGGKPPRRAAAKKAALAPMGPEGGGGVDDEGVIQSLDYHQRAILVALRAVEANVLLPGPEAQGLNISVYDDLIIFVEDWERTLRLIALHEATYAALELATQEIVTAHRLAAAVVVTPPGAGNVAAIVADLNEVSEYVRRNQNFEAVLSLLEAAANAYGGAAPAGPPVAGADQFLYIGGEKIPLKKSTTDFIVHTSADIPRDIGQDASVLGLETVVDGACGLDGMLEKRLSSRLALFQAPDAASRDAAMAEVRQETVAHHVYERADTGETVRINDRLYLKLRRERPGVLDRLLDEHKLRYLRSMGGQHLLQVTEASQANGLKVAAKLLADPDVESCHPEILRSLGRQDGPPVTAGLSLFKHQWYLEDGLVSHPDLKQGADIDVQGAWAYTTGDEKTVVAVIDDGFDLGHPAFAQTRIHPQARNFWASQESADVSSRGGDYHGTPVAGIISGSPGGGAMHGIAPGCTLLPIRIEFGAQAPSDILKVFEHASRYADVVNCSFGFSPSSFSLEEALKVELEKMAQTGGPRGKGVVFVFSAGNHDAPTYLEGSANVNGIVYFSYSQKRLVTLKKGTTVYSGYPNVAGSVTVASMSSLRRKSGYSNWGPDICVAAPSDNWHGVLYSQWPADQKLRSKFLVGYRGLGQLTASNRKDHGQPFQPLHDVPETQLMESDYTDGFGGTSGAAPVVTGVVALMLSVNSKLTAAEIRQILMETASQAVDQTLDLPDDPNLQGLTGAFNQGNSLTFGAGRISAKAAVEEAARRAGILPSLVSASNLELSVVTRRLEVLEALVLSLQNQQVAIMGRLEPALLR
jgi:subtilisin family serine protease